MKNEELAERNRRNGGLSVIELRDYLTELINENPENEDLPVLLTYDFGDRCSTQKCEKIPTPNIIYVEWSSYISGAVLAKDEPEEGDPNPPFKAVILGDI